MTSDISWPRCLRAVCSLFILEQSMKQCWFNIDGKRQRPLDTVQPLATDLGLTVDTSCERDDPDCVKDVVDGYSGTGNILICWQHNALTDIVKKLGDKDAPNYPDDRYVCQLWKPWVGANLLTWCIASILSGLILHLILLLPPRWARTALVWIARFLYCCTVLWRPIWYLCILATRYDEISNRTVIFDQRIIAVFFLS
jgi:hypothetical protein